MQPARFDRALRPVDVGGQLAGIVSADIVPSMSSAAARCTQRMSLWQQISHS
jgi:hypothetical protein